MMKFVITGERVLLRPLEPSDAETVWRWHNDPDVNRWLTADYHESFDHMRKRFENRPRNTFEKSIFAIVTDDKLIGAVGLRDATPETARAEIDIYIGEKDYWNGGYGTDALRTICRYGFDVMRLHSIALWVVVDNERAIRCYEKVGFQVDGRARDAFRGEGRWHDMLLMSLLEGELSV